MNMNITSPKFLAITFAFIVYATILLLTMATLPLHAQTNAPAENGTNSSVTVTNSAPASNAVAVTGTKAQNPSGEPSPVRINNTGTQVNGQNLADKNEPMLHDLVFTALPMLLPIMASLAPFIMVIAVIAIVFYFRHRRNKMMHETMLALIEKGVPITPELLAQLQIKPSRFSDQPGQSRNRLLLPGLMFTGVGIGLLINYFRKWGDCGAGWILLFIGVAFLIVWLVERRDKNNVQPPKP